MDKGNKRNPGLNKQLSGRCGPCKQDCRDCETCNKIITFPEKYVFLVFSAKHRLGTILTKTQYLKEMKAMSLEDFDTHYSARVDSKADKVFLNQLKSVLKGLQSILQTRTTKG